MDEQTRRLVTNLIKFGKTPEGIRLIATSALDYDCFIKVGVYDDSTLQAMEVVRVAKFFDTKAYTSIFDTKTYTSRQTNLLQSVVKFISDQH